MTAGQQEGIYFAVWAPNAERVSVIGDFNGWNPESNPLGPRWDSSGIWEGFVPGVGKGAIYKYHIFPNTPVMKWIKEILSAFYWEIPPKTASRVWDLEYAWNDHEWMRNRHKANGLKSPISVYEIHLGSWRRDPGRGPPILDLPGNGPGPCAAM